MHTLIGRLGAIQGVDRTAAGTAVGTVLPLRCRDEAVRSTPSRSDRAPGARVAVAISQTNSNSGDIRITAAGSSIRAMPVVAREAFGYARHMVGENAVGGSVGAVPGWFV
jgi:hypothetical protein